MKRLSLAILSLVAICFLNHDVAAQQRPDLQIDNFSVSSTLVGPDSLRRVTVSFRVLNAGAVQSIASRTRITMANSTIDFNTPALSSGASAFISRGLRTGAGEVPIAVQADILNAVTESNEQNNVARTTAKLRAEEGRWISIGPSRIKDFSTDTVGRITAISVSPISLFVVYAGARGTGLWKTIDTTGNWFPIGDSLPSLQIDAIAIDPRDDEHVFVATPAGLFESKDGGSVWTQLTAVNLQAFGADGGRFLIPNRFNPPMYLTTLTGLQVSTDGGRNWKVVLGSQNSQVTSVQFSTNDQTRLFAASIKPPAIFEATNGGLTATSWRQLLGCPGAALPSMPANARIWVAESKGKMYMSFRADTGNNTTVNQIWRTANTSCNIGGISEQSWEQVSLSGECNKFPNHFSYLFAHPTNPEIVFKGGIQLCRSDKNGSGMSTVRSIHPDHHAIAVAPSAPAVMFFGSDGGIYRSADKGATLRFVGEGLSNSEFLSLDTDGTSPNVVVAGSQDNGFSTWDGLTPVWSYKGGGDSSIVEFDVSDPARIFETGQSTRQIKRFPGGSSQGSSPLPDLCSYTEFPSNPGFPGHLKTNMVSIGGNPLLAVTAHGVWVGPPWTEIQPPAVNNPPPPDRCDNLQSGDFTRLKLGPTGGLMVAVTNMGRVLFGLPHQPPLTEVMNLNVSAAPTAIAFAGPGTFYVSFDSNGQASIWQFQCFAGCQRKLICSDADASIKCPGSQPAITGTKSGITAMVVDPAAPEALIVAVRNRGVFRGAPGTGTTQGFRWTEYNNGLPDGVVITDLKARSNKSIIAATYGRGAYQVFTKIVENTPLTVTGRIVSLDSGRVNPGSPPGANNPILTTVEIDSKPGFSFSTTNATLGFRLRSAFQNKRRVRLTFQLIAAGSGNILTVTTLP
jgi:photosystem II stability/assembly factor-like uncharacterized protein